MQAASSGARAPPVPPSPRASASLDAPTDVFDTPGAWEALQGQGALARRSTPRVALQQPRQAPRRALGMSAANATHRLALPVACWQLPLRPVPPLSRQRRPKAQGSPHLYHLSSGLPQARPAAARVRPRPRPAWRSRLTRSRSPPAPSWCAGGARDCWCGNLGYPPAPPERARSPSGPSLCWHPACWRRSRPSISSRRAASCGAACTWAACWARACRRVSVFLQGRGFRAAATGRQPAARLLLPPGRPGLPGLACRSGLHQPAVPPWLPPTSPRCPPLCCQPTIINQSIGRPACLSSTTLMDGPRARCSKSATRVCLPEPEPGHAGARAAPACLPARLPACRAKRLLLGRLTAARCTKLLPQTWGTA